MNPFVSALFMSAGAGGITPSSVFDIDLWTGTNLSNAITTPFAPSMVWIKSRSNATDYALFDTTRGAGIYLGSNTTAAQATDTTTLNAFNAGGYTLTTDVAALVNTTTRTYVGWAFKETTGFFDVVTYTGNSTNRTIAHNLGVVPGMILVKKTNSAADWQVYHRSLANTDYLVLNSTAASATGATRWNSTTPTTAVFSLGTDTTVNNTGDTYVAYLFAHDPSGIVQCGTFTSILTGSGGNTVSLGWQPQLLFHKSASSTGGWSIFDTTRGWSATQINWINPNSTATETSVAATNYSEPTATGFTMNVGSNYYSSGDVIIYMAIKA